jgi:RNA polymerase sigma factor (sigma-70 family)
MQRKEKIFEEYLVAGARLGDKTAIDQLVMLRGPKLLSHARRLLGNLEDAHDAVQDAWIEILRGLPKLRDERAFPAWAYRIVTRRAARIISGHVSRRAMAAELEQTEPAEVAETATAATDAEAVRQAINQLPPAQAAAISLFYLEDMTVREVALALDIPIGTVKTRLMHARHALSQSLKGEEDE